MLMNSSSLIYSWLTFIFLLVFSGLSAKMGLNSSFFYLFDANLSFFWALELFKSKYLLFMLVSLVSWLVLLYANYYMTSSSLTLRLISLIVLFVTSMLLLVSSSSPLLLLTGWDGLGVSSYFLVLHYTSVKSSASAKITVITNRVGDVFLIVYFVILIFSGFSNWYLNSHFSVFFMNLVILASFTKSAQFPFSNWLPEAMAAPTPVSSLVHSSTLVIAGVFLVYLINTNLPMQLWMLVSIVAGWTLILASTAGMMISDVKKLVALSTLSQMALLYYVLPLGLTSLILLHMMTHALFKSGLFMSLGLILHSSKGAQDMRTTVVSNDSSANQFVLLSIMGLVGMMGTSGFISKELILNDSLILGPSWLVYFTLALATVGTFSYSWRVVSFVKDSKSIGLKDSFSDFSALFVIGLGFILSLLIGPYYMEMVFKGWVSHSVEGFMCLQWLLIGFVLMYFIWNIALNTL